MSIREPRNLSERKATAPSTHGEVFTQRWVVELILDSVGYTVDRDLGSQTIVEPACGCGAFIVPIVERLLESARLHDRHVADLAGAVVAHDLLPHNAEIARKAAVQALVSAGEDLRTAEDLAEHWIRTEDFLLTAAAKDSADYVVGNPPYVRIEDIPTTTSDAYRDHWSTMRGRSDLYIGFFEKSLKMLRGGGRLGFICADRWMRNHYGARLRKMVSDTFAVESIIVMHDVDAFENEVSAYPAVAVLQRASQGPAVLVETTKTFGEADASTVSKWLRSDRRSNPPTSEQFSLGVLPGWFEGPGLWPSGSPRQLELIARIEGEFDTLEDEATGTRVGIGVATGCDEVYIRHNKPTGVGQDRMLPLLTTQDLTSTGRISWSGNQLVSPWDENGLVDLRDHEGLAKYYQQHQRKLRTRHVARKNPNRWYRTIDRVDPDLVATPKLVLPDIKSSAEPVLDPGKFYPHHNLYYITSVEWDLEVLGGILLSDVTDLFIGAYCVKMRGGTYRFQAQYLRKIRVPDWRSLGPERAEDLRRAFRTRDRELATKTACELYGIEPEDLNPH